MHHLNIQSMQGERTVFGFLCVFQCGDCMLSSWAPRTPPQSHGVGRLHFPLGWICWLSVCVPHESITSLNLIRPRYSLYFLFSTPFNFLFLLLLLLCFKSPVSPFVSLCHLLPLLYLWFLIHQRPFTLSFALNDTKHTFPLLSFPFLGPSLPSSSFCPSLNFLFSVLTFPLPVEFHPFLLHFFSFPIFSSCFLFIVW